MDYFLVVVLVAAAGITSFITCRISRGIFLIVALLWKCSRGSYNHVVPSRTVVVSIARVENESVRVALGCPQVVVGVVLCGICSGTDTVLVREVHQTARCVVGHHLVPSVGVSTHRSEVELVGVHVEYNVNNNFTVLMAVL